MEPGLLDFDDSLVRRHLTDDARRSFGVRPGFEAYDGRQVAASIGRELGIDDEVQLLRSLEAWAESIGGDVERIEPPRSRAVGRGRVRRSEGPPARRLNVPTG